MIRFENVSKVYARGARPALDTVSVDIARGEFVFLVGASGSGKSTFLRLALREERPTRGKVYVAGRDLSRLSGWKVPSLRRGIGMVFQDFRLLPNKTVYENVAFALEVIGKPRHTIKTTVPAVLEMVGLDGKEKRRPHELSGGEQQRVAIARAFVNRPPILLADEPTGNLDPTTSLGIMRLLERINRTGTTLVMATHDEEIVNEMRKRVVELSGGYVVRDEAAGVYGERERILPDIAASSVLDAPATGERQVHSITPDASDVEAEGQAAAAAARAEASATSVVGERARRQGVLRRANRRPSRPAAPTPSGGESETPEAAGEPTLLSADLPTRDDVEPIAAAAPSASPTTPDPDDDAASAAEPAVPAADLPAPVAEPAVPAADLPVPVVEPAVPAAGLPAPAAEPAVPVAEPAVPAADLPEPAAEPAVPVAEAVPAADLPVPAADLPAPAAEPAVPVAEPAVPAADLPVPAAEPAVPAADLPVPAADLPAPAADLPAPAAEPVAPAADQPAPAADPAVPPDADHPEATPEREPEPEPLTYATPSPYAATRPVDPSARRPPDDFDDVVQQVLRERALRTGREG